MPQWLQVMLATLQEDFADLPDISQWTRLTLRLVVAGVLGGILGYERESKGKAAGMRTHMLVAVGAALFILIPQQSKIADADLTRVLQGLVAGIGFLGAGAILKGTDEEVSGLTTAASIWLTAAIGVACGMGREISAILSTLLALIILAALPRVERLINRRDSQKKKQET